MGSLVLTPAAAARELMLRRRMRESLVGFAEGIQIPGAPVGADDGELVFRPVGSGMASHHVLLMEALQRCMTTRYGRLMVFMPPGSAKSTYASSVGPAWYLGNHPGAKVILASFALDLAKKHGRKARAIVKQAVYQGVFGAELSGETSAAEMWAIAYGDGRPAAEYMAGSFQSGITGNRGWGIVIDDPIKGRVEADSPTVRKHTLEVFEDDIMTRLVPGAWIVLVQTRWHDEDLAGSLLPENYNGESGPIMCRDGMVWEVLNIPAESERTDDPLGRPIGDGVGGVPGSMLWEGHFDEMHWRQFRVNERTWSALYQQRPRPEKGGQFQRAWANRYELGHHPKWLRRYIASDFAVTEDDKSDFTEHGVWGIDADGNLWALDWWYGQLEADKTIAEQLRLVKRHGIRQGFGEVGVIRRAIEPLFRDLQRRTGVRVKMDYLPHIGNKIAKFQAFRGIASSGRVFIPHCPWGDRLLDQLCVFPGREHDDAVDVCSLIGMAVDELVAGKAPVHEERPPEPVFGSWAYLTQEVDEPVTAPRVF